MFKYKLKAGQESFTPVEGPFALKTYAPGKLYAEIPPGTEGKFERIPDEASAPDPEASKPAQRAVKKGPTAGEAPENGEVKS